MPNAESRYDLDFGTEDGTLGGTLHPHRVDAEGKLRTKDVDAITVLTAISNLSTDIKALVTTQNSLTTDVKNLTTTQNSLTTDLKGLSTDIKALATTQNSLTTDVKNLTTTNNSLTTDLKSLTTDIKALITTLSGQLPASLGQKTAAASLSVTLPSGMPSLNTKISGTDDGQSTGTERVFVNTIKNQILNAKDRAQTISYADFGTKDQRVTQISYTAVSIGTGAGFTARKTISYTLVGNSYRRDSISWTLV